jgi:TonB family protein
VLALTLGTSVATAQRGPIEPIILAAGKPSATLASLPDLGADYVIPVEVHVAADGTVTSVTVSPPSGNADADQVAVSFMKEKTFLPAIDLHARPVPGVARGSVEIKAATRMKQLKANMKPPNIDNEVARVRKLTCRDFLWEIDRLRTAGASATGDVSREVMPRVSLRLSLLEHHLPAAAELDYIDRWPQTLIKVESACRKTPDHPYFQVLMGTFSVS